MKRTQIKFATTLGTYAFLLILNSNVWCFENVIYMATLLSTLDFWTS